MIIIALPNKKDMHIKLDKLPNYIQYTPKRGFLTKKSARTLERKSARKKNTCLPHPQEGRLARDLPSFWQVVPPPQL